MILIAVPSFSLLYHLDQIVNPHVTIKIIGHQWYWSYENHDLPTGAKINFDSYMVEEAELQKGGLRLLEVDNRLYLPIRAAVRLLITSADVIHSWAVPSLGIKMDACPGRLNQVSLEIRHPGTFYGQCSELCGVKHSFMPIVVTGVSHYEYRKMLALYN